MSNTYVCFNNTHDFSFENFQFVLYVLIKEKLSNLSQVLASLIRRKGREEEKEGKKKEGRHAGRHAVRTSSLRGL